MCTFVCRFSGDDYDASIFPLTIIFEAGETEECSTVDIVNDDINEPPQEGFEISARFQGSAVPSSTTSVTIVDDDGKWDFLSGILVTTVRETPPADLSYSFKEPSYLVNENEGRVRVCVVLSTSSTLAVTAELSHSGGSATACQSNICVAYLVVMVTALVCIVCKYHSK